MNSLTQYIELHDQHLETIEAHAPQVLNDLRRHARRALEGAMLPRKGQEDYEATDLNAMFAPDYGVNIARLDFDIDPATVFHCDVPNMSTCMYYTYNDIFHPSGTARKLEGGVVVESLAQAAVNHPELLERCGQLASLDDPAVALNTLLAQDGILVYVPDGFTADRTIQLVNILNYTRPMMVVRRVLVILGRNAHARMLVCDHTQSTEVDCLSSQVVEIFAGEDASFDYYDMEESGPMTHRVSSIYVHQQGRCHEECGHGNIFLLHLQPGAVPLDEPDGKHESGGDNGAAAHVDKRHFQAPEQGGAHGKRLSHNQVEYILQDGESASHGRPADDTVNEKGHFLAAGKIHERNSLHQLLHERVQKNRHALRDHLSRKLEKAE